MGDVDYLYEDAGSGQLGIDDSGKAFRQTAPQPTGPSLSGPTPKYSVGVRAGMGGSPANPHVAGRIPERRLSSEELLALSKKRLPPETLMNMPAKEYNAYGWGDEMDKRLRAGQIYDNWTDGEDQRQEWIRQHQKPAERHYTPEELMALADAMEEKMKAEHAAQMAQGPAVKNGEPPQWLSQYMEKQPFTDPYHQEPMTKQASWKNNKYKKSMTKAERKKYADKLGVDDDED